MPTQPLISFHPFFFFLLAFHMLFDPTYSNLSLLHFFSCFSLYMEDMHVVCVLGICVYSFVSLSFVPSLAHLPSLPTSSRTLLFSFSLSFPEQGQVVAFCGGGALTDCVVVWEDRDRRLQHWATWDCLAAAANMPKTFCQL